jgi:hypothetical protein
VRVDTDGSLVADAEYPWTDSCWFTILHLNTNMTMRTAVAGGELGDGAIGGEGAQAPGRRLQHSPADRLASYNATVAARIPGEPRAGATDAALAEGGSAEDEMEARSQREELAGTRPSPFSSCLAPTDPLRPAVLPLPLSLSKSRDLALPLCARPCADELWRGDELRNEWFALASSSTGALLQLHDGRDGPQAWVARADVDPPMPRHPRRRAGGSPSLPREGIVPPAACWRFDGERLRNLGTGGVLNVRRGGALRGHSNGGPPWRTASGNEESSTIALRAVPRQLREAHTSLGRGRKGGRGGGGAGGGGGMRQGAGGGNRRYSFLSVDYHIATAQDVGHTLRELGQTFVEKSLSGACARRRTCAAPSELPVLTKETAFTLCPRPHAYRRAAYEALRSSPLLHEADGVVCSHPAALCEVWLPFNKSILLIVTANLELARENAERWRDWLRTVGALAKSARVVVAANNRYDQAYVQHFTGARPLYLPTLANYITARHMPLPGKPVLLARSHHSIGKKLLQELRVAARSRPGLKVASIEEEYPGNAGGGGYEYSQLASHPAIVVVPYTKSTMTFFELYRIGIPIFVPSLALLVKWELQRHVMSERVYWKHAPSPLRNPTSPNPNSLQDRAALEHWIKLSDPYVYPHVQYFDSADDLAAKLASANTREISSRMRRHSAEMQPVMRAKWRAVMRKLFHGRPSGSWPTGGAGGFDAALRTRFGLELSATEPDCARLSAPELGQWN